MLVGYIKFFFFTYVEQIGKNNYTFFFIGDTFISNTRLKLAKYRAKVKQHPEAGFLLFANFSLSSAMLSSKSNMRYSKKCAKNKCICFDKDC